MNLFKKLDKIDFWYTNLFLIFICVIFKEMPWKNYDHFMSAASSLCLYASSFITGWTICFKKYSKIIIELSKIITDLSKSIKYGQKIEDKEFKQECEKNNPLI